MEYFPGLLGVLPSRVPHPRGTPDHRQVASGGAALPVPDWCSERENLWPVHINCLRQAGPGQRLIGMEFINHKEGDVKALWKIYDILYASLVPFVTQVLRGRSQAALILVPRNSM